MLVFFTDGVIIISTVFQIKKKLAKVLFNSKNLLKANRSRNLNSVLLRKAFIV